MKTIGISHTGLYIPDQIETAHQISKKAGIPEDIIIHKFGLIEKRIAKTQVHASDMATAAGHDALATANMNPLEVDVIIYFGSPHKDYGTWSIAPKIQYELGAKNAYAFELTNVSSCFPIALKVAKDMLEADTSINNILLVGGCKESQLIDYANPRSRFMFNFGDGGAAALIQRNSEKSSILASHFITDGSFYDDIKVPAGGSVMPASEATVNSRLHYLDVKDPKDMKERLDPVSIPNFISVVKKAIQKSGYLVEDIDFILPLHTKYSMFQTLLKELDLTEEQAFYLNHFGHMSALDPCFGLHLARKYGRIKSGDVIVLVSAGTGYTWSATVLKEN